MERQTDKWLQEYLRWACRNESPELFHFWTGATLIATVLNRRVSAPILFDLYPNLYVILVAGSQKCRKSTAIDFGVSLLKRMVNPPFIMSQKMTPQAMMTGFMESAARNEKLYGEAISSGLIVADEIATYLNKESISQGMLPILLKLHDCQDPFEYRTQARGTERLPRSYGNLLAGSAPEYLSKSLPIEEAGGGMLARTILVYQEEPAEPKPFLTMDESHIQRGKALVKDLNRMSQLEGEMGLSEDAVEWYSAWYNEWHRGKETINREPGLKHYMNKKPDHLGALAMIISISDSDELIITKNHFERALTILNRTERLMHLPLRDIVSEGKGRIIKTVRNQIAYIYSHSEQPTFKRILRACHQEMDYEECHMALVTLKQAGIIKQHRDRQTGQYFYVPNEDLGEE